MNRRIIWNDLRNGIGKRILWFLPVLVFVFFTALSHMRLAEACGGQGSLLSASAAVLEGVRVIEDPSELLLIPPLFILLYSWLILLVAYYAHDDMKEYGIQTFIRCHQRYSWWFSKCIWNICTVILYYVLIYLACFAAAVISKGSFFKMDDTVWQILFYAEKEVPSGGILFLYLVVLPVFTSMALSMMQMFLSIVSSPIAGAMVNLVLLLVSICKLSQWLPGNYRMFLRMSVRMEGGVEFLPAVLFDLCLILAAVFAGAIVLRKKDIF